MKLNFRKYLGVALLLIGGLILLQNLNIFRSVLGSIILTSIYGLFSIYLFSQYRRRKSQWWWLILGVFLLGLAVSHLVELFPTAEQYSSIIALSGAGIGFLLIYFIDRINWWAIIPGSVLLSIGAIEYTELTSPEIPTEGFLFLGMGISFLLMFLLPIKHGRMNWPIIPAAILIAIGTTHSYSQDISYISYIGPVFLLLAGIIILLISVKK